MTVYIGYITAAPSPANAAAMKQSQLAANRFPTTARAAIAAGFTAAKLQHATVAVHIAGELGPGRFGFGAVIVDTGAAPTPTDVLHAIAGGFSGWCEVEFHEIAWESPWPAPGAGSW